MKVMWLNKNECTGCSACANICPKNAISMMPDECGFVYPQFNDACIDCGACETVCRNRVNRNKENKDEPLVYACWSREQRIRFSSTSGGAFTHLARYIVDNGGIVYGARYNEQLLVEHAKAENYEEIELLKQSKYVQSDIGIVYKDIRKHLNNGRKVLFVGTPCQVAGLIAYLESKYTNLYLIDFICRGVNSPKAFKAWLSEIEIKQRKKIKSVWFKYKINGWKKSPTCTRVDYLDGSYGVFCQEENRYMDGYLGTNLYIRPSCGNCSFKGIPRNSDITVADFWKITAEIDDDNGTSMVLVNNEKGEKWFDLVKKDMIVHQRDFSEIFVGNRCFTESVIVPKESVRFLKGLDGSNFSNRLKWYERYFSLKGFPSRVYKKIMRRNV